jgi:hypothetical protein
MTHDRFATLKELRLPSGARGRYHSLPALEAAGIGKVSRMPMSLRVVLESVLRNCDGVKVTEQHVRQVANWAPAAERVDEIPFIVARVVLQDFTGVPLLADLAAMRSAAAALGRDARLIEPLVPVDLVVDHSVMVDYYGSPEALELNMRLEFKRNAERYQFMKWGMQAFDTFRVVPPGIGIVHQVNLEYLARGVHQRDGVWFPDSLVGTDSHTTMINGIGVVGWGVGRHRGRGGDAGAARLHPDPRRHRRRDEGAPSRGRHRDRPRADGDRDAAQGEGRREVRRVLRRRRGDALGAGPRDDRQHVARVRRDDRVLPGRRRDDRLPALDRTHRGGDRGIRGLLQGAADVRHAARGRPRLHAVR